MMRCQVLMIILQLKCQQSQDLKIFLNSIIITTEAKTGQVITIIVICVIFVIIIT